MPSWLRTLLEPHFQILGSVEDGRELIAAVSGFQPDAVVLDISMPGLNGIEAAIKLKKALPRTKLVFLTMHADPVYVSGGLRAGASGYVLKSSAAAELVGAIEKVLGGEAILVTSLQSGFQAATRTQRNRSTHSPRVSAKYYI